MSTPKTLTLKLDFTVTYDLNGTDPRELECMLINICHHALEVGLVTGSTNAVVANTCTEVLTVTKTNTF